MMSLSYMTDNKQTVLTDEEIQDIADGFDIYGAKPEFARAIASAVLSKLRAGREPIGWIDINQLREMGDAWVYQCEPGHVAEPGEIPVFTTAQANADYQSVVDEALVVRHLGVSSGDARADLKRVLDWEVAVALDPAVSSDAQALIDKGRNEEAEHFHWKLKDPNVVHVNMLRGTIAPITFDQLAHILGDEATAKWISSVASAKGAGDVALPPRKSENGSSSYEIAHAMAYNQALDDAAKLNADRQQRGGDAKDAERYRWLISSHWYVGPEPDGEFGGVSWNDHNATKDGVTQAIDAAIAQQRQGEGG